MPRSDRTRHTRRSAWSALIAVLVTLTAPGTPAHAATTCTDPAVSNYHVDENGKLRRWTHGSPLTGNATWNQAVISPAWSATKTISGGDGVIFTITPSGSLVWHRDNNHDGSGGPEWHSQSGSVIGTGWSPFTTVLGGGDGVIYALASDGRLYWYRYMGSDGQVSWANNGAGRQIGSGWNGFLRIATSGNGVLYAVQAGGQLRWYRHLDPDDGTNSWANGGSATTVGSGWAGFTKLASLGAGILLGRNSTGTLFWYRHLDPLGGTTTWANGGSGIGQGTGWNNNELVADVTGCRAT